jgi:hypothetical protein
MNNYLSLKLSYFGCYSPDYIRKGIVVFLPNDTESSSNTELVQKKYFQGFSVGLELNLSKTTRIIIDKIKK